MVSIILGETSTLLFLQKKVKEVAVWLEYLSNVYGMLWKYVCMNSQDNNYY